MMSHASFSRACLRAPAPNLPRPPPPRSVQLGVPACLALAILAAVLFRSRQPLRATSAAAASLFVLLLTVAEAFQVPARPAPLRPAAPLAGASRHSAGGCAKSGSAARRDARLCGPGGIGRSV